MIIGGILLHGICYDFLFVTGQIYVDKRSTARIRGQAQGLFVLVTLGLGMLVGAQLAGITFNHFLQDAAVLTLAQWQSFWWIPAVFALVVLAFFAMLFNDRSDRKTVMVARVATAAPAPVQPTGMPDS